jgi:outer membrane protein OmpA-like peptidoglycan-associated protein
LARSLHRTLILAAVLVGTAWSSPVQPGRNADGPAVALLVESPTFAISAQRGIVTLAGHTMSSRHERQLQQVVASLFPDQDHVFEFRPFGPAPGWWTEATTELVTAIASLRAPRVSLDDDMLIVRALAGQPGTAEARLAAVTGLLPGSLEKDIRILGTGPDVEARSLCTRHFEAFRNGPIRFFESGTEMRPSARPELERVVALAAACRDARVSITGHTDASGSEEWNRTLSLERARAVGDWLVERGVEEERIVLAGAGSAEPVASNDTRYGRSLNRRIDIAFAYAD